VGGGQAERGRLERGVGHVVRNGLLANLVLLLLKVRARGLSCVESRAGGGWGVTVVRRGED
jgi:hypothetical protein